MIDRHQTLVASGVCLHPPPGHIPVCVCVCVCVCLCVCVREREREREREKAESSMQKVWSTVTRPVWPPGYVCTRPRISLQGYSCRLRIKLQGFPCLRDMSSSLILWPSGYVDTTTPVASGMCLQGCPCGLRGMSARASASLYTATLAASGICLHGYPFSLRDMSTRLSV